MAVKVRDQKFKFVYRIIECSESVWSVSVISTQCLIAGHYLVSTMVESFRLFYATIVFGCFDEHLCLKFDEFTSIANSLRKSAKDI